MPPVSEIVFPTDIESSLTETEGRTLAELADGKVVLELGAWLGRSTVCLAQTAERVFSVDWHQGDEHAGATHTLGPYLQNLIRYGLLDTVVPIVGRFEDVLPSLRAGYFDMVFLDGFHTYDAVKADIYRILLLEPSLMVFHDYGVEASSHGGGEFGVTKAVDELFGRIEVIDSLAIVEADDARSV
jgi:hypothetical protein